MYNENELDKFINSIISKNQSTKTAYISLDVSIEINGNITQQKLKEILMHLENTPSMNNSSNTYCTYHYQGTSNPDSPAGINERTNQMNPWGTRMYKIGDNEAMIE